MNPTSTSTSPESSMNGTNPHNPESLEHYKYQVSSTSSQIRTLQSAISTLQSKHSAALSSLSSLQTTLTDERFSSARREEQADELLQRSVRYINAFERRCEEVTGQLQESRKKVKEGTEREKTCLSMYNQTLNEHHKLLQTHEDIKHLLSETQESLAVKTEEAQKVMETMEKLEEEVRKAKEEEEKARKQTSETQSRVEALEAETRSLQDQLAESSSSLNALSLQLTQLTQQHASIAAELKSCQDALTLSQQTLETERETQMQCVRSLQGELDETLNALSTAEGAITSEKALAGELKVSLCVAEVKVKDLESQLADAQEELARTNDILQRTSEATEAAQKTLQVERDGLFEECTKLEKEVKSKSRALGEALSLVEQEKKAKESVVAQLDLTQAELTHLKSLIHNHNQQASSTDGYSFTSTGEAASTKATSVISGGGAGSVIEVVIEKDEEEEEKEEREEQTPLLEHQTDPNSETQVQAQDTQAFPKSSPAPSIEIDVKSTSSGGGDIPPVAGSRHHSLKSSKSKSSLKSKSSVSHFTAEEKHDAAGLDIPKLEFGLAGTGRVGAGGSLGKATGLGSNGRTQKRGRVTSMFHMGKLSNAVGF